MSIRFANPDEIARWDELLTSNPDGGNIFQSTALAETKHLSGWIPRYLVIDNITVTVLEKSVFGHGIYWYFPKGPGVTCTEELLSLLPELKQFANEQGVFAIKLEPEILETDDTHAAFRAAGLVRTAPVQPNNSTVIIDLSPDLDTILANFNQKGRHALKRAERDGIVTEAVPLTEENMQIMFDMLRSTAIGRFEASLRDYQYYRTFWQKFAKNDHGSLFFARFDGKVVASAFCMFLGKKGLYKDGASLREKVTYGASHLLQWEVIKWMKAHGVESYDLCGAPHSSAIRDDSNPLYGIGRFKTSFNKHVTDYVGCYDLVVNPTVYKRWQRFGLRLALSLSWRLKKQQWF